MIKLIRPSPPYFVGVLDWHADPEDDYTFKLNRKLEFLDSRGELVEAPAGMRTDGASVRQLLEIPLVCWLTRWVLQGEQFTGPFRWPAVIHDSEYGRAAAPSLWEAFRSPERQAADRRIREGALAKIAIERVVAGVCECSNCTWVRDRVPASRWRAWTVWAMLRLAGAPAWLDDSSKAQQSQIAIARAAGSQQP